MKLLNRSLLDVSDSTQTINTDDHLIYDGSRLSLLEYKLTKVKAKYLEHLAYDTASGNLIALYSDGTKQTIENFYTTDKVIYEGNAKSGDIGARGYTGLEGLDGRDGNRGAPGVVGAKGNVGNRGITGDRGERGEVGDKGISGYKGNTGEIGFKGFTGDIGPVGVKGVVGDLGWSGVLGLKGPTGDSGIKGEPGPRGCTGEFGKAGREGNTGSAGIKGISGDTGTRGLRGAVGEEGKEGIPSYVNTLVSGKGVTITSMNQIDYRIDSNCCLCSPPIDPCDDGGGTTQPPGGSTTTPGPGGSTTTPPAKECEECKEGYLRVPMENGTYKCVCSCLSDVFFGFGASTSSSTASHEIAFFHLVNKYVNITRNKNFAPKDGSINVSGDAKIIDGYLVLTDNTASQAGNGWYNEPVQFMGRDHVRVDDFSLAFSSRITSSGMTGGDGLSIILQGGNDGPNSRGRDYGVTGVINSVSVNIGDSSSKVSISLHGNVNSPQVSAPIPFSILGTPSNKQIFFGWVDYKDQVLKVYLNNADKKPGTALLTYPIDIGAYVVAGNATCAACAGLTDYDPCTGDPITMTTVSPPPTTPKPPDVCDLMFGEWFTVCALGGSLACDLLPGQEYELGTSLHLCDLIPGQEFKLGDPFKCSDIVPTCREGYYLTETGVDANGCKTYLCSCKCVDSTYIGFGAATGGSKHLSLLTELFFRNDSYTTYLQGSSLVSNNQFNYVGSAGPVSNISPPYILLCPDEYGSGGNAWLKAPISMADSSLKSKDFEVFFVVNMSQSTADRADGLSFTIQSEGTGAGGIGGGIAYAGIRNSVTVALDTYWNRQSIFPGYNDATEPNNNHVEVSVDGDIANPIASAIAPFDMVGKNNIAIFGTNTKVNTSCWIDYKAGILSVYLINDINGTKAKPATPLITVAVDIAAHVISITEGCTNCVGKDAYVP